MGMVMTYPPPEYVASLPVMGRVLSCHDDQYFQAESTSTSLVRGVLQVRL